MAAIDVVTGGAGFIGAHLVKRLVASGRMVRVIDNLSTGRFERLQSVRDRIEFVQADLVRADLAPLVRHVGRLFHLAAVPSVPRSVRDPFSSHQAIATATLRLLIAARDANVRHVVLSSSSSVYGDSEVSPKHEGLPIGPISPYAVAKAAAEGYARAFASLYGLHTVSLRYFNVFGPDQDPDSAYAAVIPLFVTRALAREELVINGDGTQTRDFTFVDNVVDANLAAANDDVPPGSVFNVAAGDPHSLLDLASEIGRLTGHEPRLAFRPARAGDILHSHADVSAAERELGWRPRIGFADGLIRTIAWYRER